MENKRVEDIAWVKTDSDYLLLIARDSRSNCLERGVSKFSKPNDSLSFSWESLEEGFPDGDSERYKVLDISQDSGWLLCMTSESDIKILNGLYPSKKPCPERQVGNGLENNSSALGCIRKATSDTIAGVLSYFKYAEFGFFELQRTGEIEKDSGDDETSNSTSGSCSSDSSSEENEEESQEIWEEASYQYEWEETDPLLAASQNIAIEAYSGRITLYYFDDIPRTLDKKETKEKKEMFDCSCGRKYILTVG